MRLIFLAVTCLLSLISPQAFANDLSGDDIRRMAEAERDDAVTLYREFLSLPNDAAYPDDIENLIQWMEDTFAARGFAMQRIETSRSPLLLAERMVENADRTILVYLQSDGQPVDPTAWDQPNPYEAVLKARNADGNWEIIDWSALESERNPDWRIFARSASDSKGPMTQFLKAMDAINKAEIELPYNLKVIIDTEEELGSPPLPAAVEANRDLLASDFLLIFDGPPHASNEPTVKFGARGIITLTLTTHGPKAPQHSGHYGNFAPNPAFHLARILGSMKTADGRVAIDGYYDGVEIPKDVKAMLDAVPDDEDAILAGMGLKVSDQVADTLQASVQYPSLNIRGMRSAWVGSEARTIVPATAVAEIDIRTVKESDPEYLVGLVRDHISDLGYTVLDHEPTDAERTEHDRIVTLTYKVNYAAFRTDFDAPPGLMARAGMKRLYGEDPILIRTSGGSIPISPFVDTLGIPAASVPTVNIDNNQHSPNENIRLGNFDEGIAIIISVLTASP